MSARPGTPTARGRVEVIDYLRLAAALAVMCFHYLYNGIRNGKVSSLTHGPLAEVASYGYLGVHLFFMISGYVITASVHGKSARQFAVGRALRLYPTFWAALAITTCFALVLGGERMGVTAPQVLVNLTMIPTLLGQPFVDGVYWTLLYELSFYGAVFVLILCGQGERVASFMPAWAFLMLYIELFAPDLAGAAPYLGGYFIWFAAGAIVASIAESGWSLYRGAGLLAAYLPIWGFELTVESVLKTLIVLAVLSTLIPRVRALHLPGSATAGALTYPVYLLHAHIGYMLLDHFATDRTAWFITPLIAAGVIAAAYLLHVVVEKDPRSRRFWRWLLDGTVGRAVGLLETGAVRVREAEARRRAAQRVSA